MAPFFADFVNAASWFWKYGASVCKPKCDSIQYIRKRPTGDAEMNDIPCPLPWSRRSLTRVKQVVERRTVRMSLSLFQTRRQTSIKFLIFTPMWRKPLERPDRLIHFSSRQPADYLHYTLYVHLEVARWRCRPSGILLSETWSADSISCVYN